MSAKSTKFRKPSPLAVGLVVAIALAGMFASTLHADVKPEDVRRAIQRGVGFLKNQQRRDGSWPPYSPNYVGGMTAICTLALLESGVPVEDPHIQAALRWLRDNSKDKITSTYPVALTTMVFAKAEPKRDLLLIQRNVKRLQDAQLPNGSWTYQVVPPPPPGEYGDPSNSQFATLALYMAEQVGAETSSTTWQKIYRYWTTIQNKDGSWGYFTKFEVGGTGSMTCAGIASMVMAGDVVRAQSAKVEGGTIECCLPVEEEENQVTRGLRWLAMNFTVRKNPGQLQDVYGLYYLYALERAGRLTAHRFIGPHDWYREGADFLVNRGILQTDYWVGKGLGEQNKMLATSYALLFLSKGRRPVLIAKAEHGSPQSWNAHQSDVANLTRFVEKKWERDMTWQVIDLKTASIDDLVETPVLYFSGKENPLPNNPADRKKLAEKLRGYLDRGGFLFAEGYCKGSAFDVGFRQLIKDIFPEPEYTLRLLDVNHPIWSAEEQVPPSLMRPIYGINFGCRTSVVYFPPDPPENPRPSLSCLWELSRPGRNVRYNEDVELRINAGLTIGMNVLAYATGRELRAKDEVLHPTAEQSDSSIESRGQIAIATIRHPGGCTAAPLSVVRLLETASEKLGIRTRPEQRIINLTDDALFDYHLVFFHGRSAFHLTDRERRRLREFVERGGTVFADSICASKTFTESFRREMAAAFPDQSLQSIPSTDPIFSTQYGGYDVSQVERQDPPETGSESRKPTIRKVPPSLEGIKIDGRWGVIFSPYDVSCALERHNSVDCRGYTRESAAQIALNVLLYSLQE